MLPGVLPRHSRHPECASESCRRGGEQRQITDRFWAINLGAGSVGGLPSRGERLGSDASRAPEPMLVCCTLGHCEGGSTELIRRVRRFQIAQYRCLVVKYDKDVRYDANRLATHDRNTMEAVAASRLRDVYQQALNSCVIGIDEGQFFPDTVEFCEEMANLGKTVIVAALDGTFQRKAFGSILSLVPLAESVVKLNSVCMECYREAAYTKRLGAETEVEVIGGSDKYHAVCRRCYFRKQNLQSGYDCKENVTLGVPEPVQKGKQRASSTPRKLFAQLQL